MCPRPRRWGWRVHASSVTIRVTVFVVVVVVVIKDVVPPCWMVSVVEFGGFFKTCSRHSGRSRHKVLMLFASFERNTCVVPVRVGTIRTENSRYTLAPASPPLKPRAISVCGNRTLTRRSGSSGQAAQNNKSTYRAYTSPSSSPLLSALPLSTISISQQIGNCPATTSVLRSRWSPCRSSRERNSLAQTFLMMKPVPHDWNSHYATRRQEGHNQQTISLSGDVICIERHGSTILTEATQDSNYDKQDEENSGENTTYSSPLFLSPKLETSWVMARITFSTANA